MNEYQEIIINELDHNIYNLYVELLNYGWLDVKYIMEIYLKCNMDYKDLSEAVEEWCDSTGEDHYNIDIVGVGYMHLINLFNLTLNEYLNDYDLFKYIETSFNYLDSSIYFFNDNSRFNFIKKFNSLNEIKRIELLNIPRIVFILEQLDLKIKNNKVF